MRLIEENKSYLPWIVGVLILHFIVVQTIKLSTLNEWAIQVEEVIFYSSLLIIPLGTVNVIYLFKIILKKQSLFWIPRLIGMLVGVTLFTLFFEYIYYLNDIVDDDYYVIGDYTASLTLSEIIDNQFIALFIGLPVFLKQQIKDRTTKAIVKKERELEKAYELKIRLELDAAHSKVNPHFLYNSLNSIASLIHEDTLKAEKMIFLLSDLFRYTLNYDSSAYSTIANEIDMVNAYLAIEMIRFEDKLECEISVEESIKSILIPRFLLQPLVENAIKHGTSKMNAGVIQLNVSSNNNDVVISVTDNGPDFPEEPSYGYGLEGTIEKLNLLYKDNYSLELFNYPQKKIEIVLKKMLLDVQ